MPKQNRQRRRPSSLSREVIFLASMFLVGFSGQLYKRIACEALNLPPKGIFKARRSTKNISKHFISSQAQELSNTMNNSENTQPVKAKLVSLDSLEDCGGRLRQGDLVAFPTETVYGLGCNALDESAIIKVFQAKERPLTDPLITHVTKNDVAYDLWSAEPTTVEGKALRVLCDKFWPGPLTLVAKAASHVPSILMAGTGFVACRAPQHPISIALIDAAKVPIAAPSANKFGHVSPTRAHHVWDDLLHEDVWIVETDDAEASRICDVGVESSVAKVEVDEQGGQQSNRITLLRQGAVSVEDIKTCLDEAGLGNSFLVEAKTKKACSDTVATVAPGQTIRHYSPNIPSFMLSRSCCDASELSSNDKAFLSKTVIIDFGGNLKTWNEFSIAYRDLSGAGDSAEATKSVFETLRWAERVDGATQIVFPDIVSRDQSGLDALSLALKDRLTRAASGVVLDNLES